MAAVYLASVAATLIKKYGNRRLYDTGDSRYITLEELAAKIRGGTDVRVVDATDGNDLTQVTLTQLILENGTAARMLPVPLLTQLIRLGDDALGEFFSRYVTAALDLYLNAKRGIRSIADANPLARLPVGATDALARMWMNSPMGQMMGFGQPGYPPPPYEPAYGGRGAVPTGHGPENEGPGDFIDIDESDDPARGARQAPDNAEELASMRREIDELKRAIRRDDQLGKPGARRKRKG